MPKIDSTIEAFRKQTHGADETITIEISRNEAGWWATRAVGDMSFFERRIQEACRKAIRARGSKK